MSVPTFESNDLPPRMVCWPKHWLEAMVNAGLGCKEGDSYRIFGGDGMRDKLQAFASAITEDSDGD